MNWHLGSAWMCVAALAFALMGAFVKWASAYYAFYEIVFWRTFFAVCILLAEALWHKRRFYTPYVWTHLTRGFAGSMGLVLFFYAISYLPLATAVTLNYTSPLWLALLSFIFLKERLSWFMLVILCLGFVGVVILLQPSLLDGQEWAGLVGLAAGGFAGWAYLQVRELTSLGEPEWKIVLSFSLVAVLITGTWSTVMGWHPIDLRGGALLLGVGFFALIAQMSLTRAYKEGQKYLVASLSYLTVVFAAIFGVLWFSDDLGWQELLGMVIIVASGILGSVFNYFNNRLVKRSV